MTRQREREAKRWLPTNSEAWRRLRKFILAREPLCRMCGQPATDVDHVNGRADRAEDNAHSNLQALCKPCHSRKTGHERAGTALKGCDVDGTPLAQKGPKSWG